MYSRPDAGSRSAHSTDGLPARPIQNKLAVWIPRVAASGCMGLTYWFASRSDEAIKGVYALAFPFFGSDPASRLQASYLVSNLISPMLIWTVEGSRAGNALTPLAFTSVVGGMMQVSGIERVAPIYYLFAIAAGDASTSDPTVDPNVAEAALPITLLAYALPGALMALLPLTATEVSRSTLTPQSMVTHAFFFAPVAVPLMTTAISKALRRFKRRHSSITKRSNKGTKATGKNCDQPIAESSKGVSTLKSAYAASFIIQAGQHIYTLARAFILSSAGHLSFKVILGNILIEPAVPGHRYSSLALYAGATLGFGLYTVWDLRRRGYTTNRETSKAALGVVAGQVFFGPGATYAGIWWWREGVLTTCVQRSGLYRP